jgi:hypothetical protein
LLCKNIVPKTYSLKNGAYIRVSQELTHRWVSSRYVGDVLKKHKEEILNPLNKDIYVCIKYQNGPGHPQKVSVAELHVHVKAVPFHFCKNIRTPSFKIGIPTTTLH